MVMVTPRDEHMPPEPRRPEEQDDNDFDWLARQMAEPPPNPIRDVEELAEQ